MKSLLHNLRPSGIGAVVLALIFSPLLACYGEPAVKLQEFSLSDQFEKTHQVRFPRPKPVIITVTDRKGADLLAPWIAALKTECGSSVELLGIADVSSVPVFLHKSIRKKFVEKYSHPVMLDWNGKVVAQLSAIKGLPNLYLFDSSGSLIAEAQESFSPEALQKLVKRIPRPLLH